MIIKNFEVDKIDFQKSKYFLLYGNNKGHINQVIKENFINKLSYNVYKYEESEIIINKTEFFNKILNNSFFEKEKLIIISRITEKSKVIIEEINHKSIHDTAIIFVAGMLEKKSNLRKYFENNKETICIAFYPDTSLTLNKIANNFFTKKKISISQLNINLIVNKCNNDRGNLLNEIKKIELLSLSKKKITTEDIMKIINLTENHSIFNLVDNCLLKDKRKVMSIVNENNFGLEDSIIILKTFLNKAKKLLALSKEYEKNNNINETIANAKPPIFWKEKDNVKKQIENWSPNKIRKLIKKINNKELQIKKNIYSPLNLILDFIFEETSRN